MLNNTSGSSTTNQTSNAANAAGSTPAAAAAAAGAANTNQTAPNTAPVNTNGPPLTKNDKNVLNWQNNPDFPWNGDRR
jgi:hypothetical protein